MKLYLLFVLSSLWGFNSLTLINNNIVAPPAMRLQNEMPPKEMIESNHSLNNGIYLTQNGMVKFKSSAPLEVILATSNELKGAINLESRTFAFNLEIASFEGFNNPLQEIHFNENYLESSNYKMASFQGKIIEKIDLFQDGEYTLRAKGKLNIHGVEQERIIKSIVKVENGKLSIRSHFSILLKEHDINIPKIVLQKIAQEILVTVEAEMIRAGT